MSDRQYQKRLDALYKNMADLAVELDRNRQTAVPGQARPSTTELYQALAESAAQTGAQSRAAAMPQQATPSLGDRYQALAENAARLEERARAAQAALSSQAAASRPEVGQDSYKSSAVHVLKNSLNGGEMSPEMGMRHDQQRFQSGLYECLNMIPLPAGGVTKRPGLEHLAEAASQSRPARLLPFVFSTAEARVLEFYGISDTACKLRVWKEDGSLVAPSLVLPWAPSILADISFCQSADVIYCAHEQIRPAKLMRLADNNWRYQNLKFVPAMEPPFWHWFGRVGNEDENGQYMNHEYVATAVDKESGEESLPSGIAHVWQQGFTSYRYMKLCISPMPNVAEYRFYKKSGGVFGYIGRSGTDAADLRDGLVVFEDHGIIADTADTPPRHKNPFASEYPALCFMFQQRLGFASTPGHPLTVWLSPSGNFESMAASIPPNDDDAIEATLAARQANRILWVCPDRNSLAIGTGGSEWLLTAPDGGAITPKNLSFQPQSSHGSQAGLEPLETGSGLLFVQRGGRVVRSFDYNFSQDRYLAVDLSLLARHVLAKSRVVAWAWQPEPYGVVWMALADGTLAGLTWLREHEVIAWHRHETEGFVESLAAIPAASGQWQLWAIVKRGTGGTIRRSVERLYEFSDSREGKRHLDGLEQTPFRARLKPCLGDIQTANGTSVMAMRKINTLHVRVVNSCPFAARIVSQGNSPGPIMSVPNRAGQLGTSFVSEADWSCSIASGWRDNPRIELIMDGDKPVTILGISLSVELADIQG